MDFVIELLRQILMKTTKILLVTTEICPIISRKMTETLGTYPKWATKAVTEIYLAVTYAVIIDYD